MSEKSPLCPERVRQLTGSVACIEHRFLRDGCWTSLGQHELLLSVFFVLVGARNGLSYYSYDTSCTLLQFSLDDDIVARNALIHQDLIAFDGPLLQVLSLPPTPVREPPRPWQSPPPMAQADPATIRRLLRDSLGADDD
jgi:hypothetical protein